MSRTGLLFALLVLIAVSSVAAQTGQAALQQALDLYRAADYEQALSVLDRVDITSASEAATVERHRAACLLALGRYDEAEQAFERLVTVAPDLQPHDLEMSPWVASAFAAVRARVLPQIEQSRRAQNRAGAPPIAAVEQPAFYTVDDVWVRRPIPLRERVPEPPAVKGVDFAGTVTLEVDIGTDGSVERVHLDGTIHPVYDAMILEAGRTWRYRPATFNAQPVKFRKALKINVS